MDYEKNIEIPFGAHDSELKGWEYTIPEGFTAEIKDGKVIVREKESKDERIRKWMINQLSAVINTESAKEFDPTGYEMAIKALSWLEKQKELPFVKDVMLGYSGLYFYDGERMHFRGNPAMEEKQKEQKQDSLTKYVYSKEDKEFIQDCANILVANDYATSAERLLSMFKPEPAEWDEEDTEMYINVASSLRGYACGLENEEHKRHIKKGLDWLENRFKSLYPQPREEIYQSAKHDLAIRFMNYLDENRPEGKMGLSNGECEDIDKAFKKNDWAKIMRYVEKYRPSWKPSEEQMQYLLAVINNPNNAGAESCHLTLGSLYNDLKKLM